MSSLGKVFPLRLPQNYHGQRKPYKKASEIYKQKSSYRQQIRLENIKISNWQRKRLDRDVVNQRRQFLVHPAKISSDTPDWFNTTSHFFHRNQAPIRRRQSFGEEKKFDVFNRKRMDPFLSENPELSRTVRRRFHDNGNITSKIGSCQDKTHGSFGFYSNQSEVTQKVGSVAQRDYTIRKPILKIGQTHYHNFIDTYSVV